MIDGGLCHTALRSQSPHLIVCQIARMIAESTTATVTAHNGLRADVKGIIEALLARMTHIHHDAQTVHLTDDLFTKLADAFVGIAASGRVTDIIVAIVTECDIDHTPLCEMLQICEVAFKRQSVLDAEHNALATLVLVHPEIVGRTCNADIRTVLSDNRLYLIKDEVGIGLGSADIETYLLGEGLAWLRLWQVAHHDGGILTTFRHLMEIDQNLRITMVEMNSLREEHRGIAMGIEREHTLMGMTSLTIAAGLANEPLEKGQTVGHTLRMPLHADDRLILTALYRLDDAVGRFGDDAELAAWLFYCLVVEGVDEEPPP